MAEKSDLEVATAWADIVIQRWETKISRLNIMETKELLRSFVSSVELDANGDPDKILFTFLYYGGFPDMGVGKGVKYDQVAGSNRRAKPWYSKQFASEVRKLAGIMAERYGDRALDAIKLIENRSRFNDAAWATSSYNH